MTTLIPSTDGVEVALHDLGGQGPPLLLLHATGFHGRAYAAVAAALADDYHVWAPDLRGHADTTTPDMPLPWSGMVDDALAVLDHLGVEHPIRAVGHSMGGATIINVELRRPGTIKAAWLFEPIIFPAEGRIVGRNPMADIARRRRAEFPSFDAAVERLLSRPLFEKVSERVLRDYVAHAFRPSVHGGIVLKASPETEARVFDGIDLELYPRIGEVDISITVVGSGGDDPASRMAPTVASGFPNARFSHWPDNTHLGPFEDPDRAAAEIRETLR